jgi:uncharacterized protein (TIGR00375 family)
VSELDDYTLLSNSDAHSLPNIAREANVFDLEEVSYDVLYNTIKNKDTNRLKYTIEFYPEEGMYHYDGHRSCGVRLHPRDTKKNKGVCPVCKKPLTVGVMYRVEELADRKEGYKPPSAVGYKKLVELDKIIAESFGIKSRRSQKVQAEYNKIIKALGGEISILKDAPLEELAQVTTPRIVEGVRRVRDGDLVVEPGYDGEYGVVKIFGDQEKEKQQPLL